jgi:polyhydroxybutyrate depolymerase
MKSTSAGAAVCPCVLFILLVILQAICGCQQAPQYAEQSPGSDNISINNPSITNQFNQRDYCGTIKVNGLNRRYWVHLPDGYNNNKSWPLVIVLHGSGTDATTMNGLATFDLYADRDGFVIVYPDAIEQDWNDGRGDFLSRSQRENIDDVAFISRLIDELTVGLNIDRKRVYATGISNGGMMSQRLGCQLADRIAAIAPVAGNMPGNMNTTCQPSRPVAVLMINGTADPIIPWQGGYLTDHVLLRGKVLSVEDTIKFWVGKNLCNTLPEISLLPDANNEDGTYTLKHSYTGRADVLLYEIKGGGHCWPGGIQYGPEKLVGKTSRDFIATEVILDFFKNHSMK